MDRFLFLFLLATRSLVAQPFITPAYNFDSLLNVEYGTATGFDGLPRTLRMDIYVPNNTPVDTTRPLLVWIHGGAFLEGSKDDASITRLAKAFARRGYVTASIGYRLGFVSDDTAHTCNYPNYSCIFATDTDEWGRALYRGVQDARGAVRYLVNRHEQFCIDPQNVFVAGESAGAFLALGTALLDTAAERPAETFALPAAPAPAATALGCSYNTNLNGTPIARPDLGGIDGDIEPTAVDYTIRGVGNMYGGLLHNWLALRRADKPRPAIFSFHRPCDPVVPIDSAAVFWGLSWCFTNGYNCFGVANTPRVYGSRTISQWNTSFNYGYTIQNQFTNVDFPYSFLFGTGSCVDQVNNPCHAYDNATLRENQLATFFAGFITPVAVCSTTGTATLSSSLAQLRVFPNPAHDRITVQLPVAGEYRVSLRDSRGAVLQTMRIDGGTSANLHPGPDVPAGPLFVTVCDAAGRCATRTVVRE